VDDESFARLLLLEKAPMLDWLLDVWWFMSRGH